MGGFLIFVTIVLIALRSFGVIAWSWWWVASPALVGIAWYMVPMFVTGIVLMAAGLFGWLEMRERSRRRAREEQHDNPNSWSK